jgi:cytoskeletal protein RodZ
MNDMDKSRNTDSVGNRLRQARLKKGLTLDEVHKKTKIHINILKALEEGGPLEISPVYLKGFLKIYSEFLGLQESQFTKQIPPPHTESSDATFTDYHNKPEPVLRVSKFRQALPAAFKFFMNKKIAIILVCILVSVGLLRLVIGQHFKKLPPKKDLLLHQAKAPKPKEVRVGVRARDDCWIRVKVDGRTIFQNILKKGRFENWQAQERIELSLGRPEVIDLEVNGRLLSSLGAAGRRVLIDKEGLRVLKK